MHNTLSPSKFNLMRENTGRSSVLSQLSQSTQIPAISNEQDAKTNQLLSRTLKFLNQSHDLVSFSKKIIVPKVRRNTFLEQIDKKKDIQSKQKLLLSQSTKNKHLSQVSDLKNTIQQDFRKDSINKRQDNKSWNSSLKQNIKKRSKTLLNKTSISLSKIQILSNLQKQQTIAEQNYNNQNYIFLNVNKSLQKNSLKEEEDEPILYPSQVPFQPKLRHNNYSYFCQQQRPTSIRQKVKSMSKYDRHNNHNHNYRNHDSFEKSLDYQSLQQRSYKKAPFTTNSLTMHQTFTKQQFASSFIKLLPIVQNKNIKKNQQHDQHHNNNDSMGGIFASLKSILLGPQSSPLKPPINNNNNTSTIIKNSQQQQSFTSQLQQISTYYYSKYTKQSQQSQQQQQQCLYTLLSSISKDKNKDTIRIYKDDFQKIYTHRYGRDRITSFFDYQYIQDYGSLLSLFQQKILKLTQQQVLLVSFMMLDYDNDGLISHSDLFRLISVIDRNRLMMRTICRVLVFVKERAKDGGVRDACEEEYLKRENFTLKKYQFMNYMKEKKKGEGDLNNINGKTRISSPKHSSNQKHQKPTKSTNQNQTIPPNKPHQPTPSPLHKYFTLLPTTQQQPLHQQFSFLKSFLTSITKSPHPTPNHFSISLHRFKTQLYPSTIPQIYYDMIYAAFGLKLPGIEYDQLDYQTPLLKVRKVVKEEEICQMSVMKQRLEKMNATRKELNGKLIRPDVKRHRRIRTILE